jgi:periplasmic copper chaperone A
MKDQFWKRRIWNHKNLLLAAALCMWGGAAAAETYTLGAIEIANPWARATPKGAPVGGAYMTITNKGTESDRLVGASMPVAGLAQVHQMIMNNGVMTMRPVDGGLEIKPGQTVTLAPGSFHIMMMGLKQPMAQGDHVKATLAFAKAGKLDLEFVVESMGAQGPSAAAPAMDHGTVDHGAMDHGAMDHGTMGNMKMNH